MLYQSNLPNRRVFNGLYLIGALAGLVTARPLGTEQRPPFFGHLAPVSRLIDGHETTITEIPRPRWVTTRNERTDPTVERLHLAGVDALEAFAYDEAVVLLHQATTLDRGNARLNNDLAVAYLERGLVQKNAADLFLALANSAKTIRLDPELEHAVFNRAAVLELLSLSREADRGWAKLADAHDGYLAHLARFRHALATRATRTAIPNAGPAWATTVLDSSGDVAQTTTWVNESPDAVRALIETKAWAGWAITMRSDPARAADHLDRLTAVGKALSDRYGDFSVASRVEQLRATLHTRPSSKDALATAIQAYSETLELFSLGRFEEARRRFEDARWLDTLEGPWRGWYRLQQARQHGARYNYEAALDTLETVIRYAENAPNPILLGEGLTLANNFHLTVGDPSAALAASRRAPSIFRQHGAPIRAARVRALHAFALEHQGQMDEAWTWLLAGLRELDGRSDFPAQAALYLCGAWLASASGEPDLALFFQRQFIEVAIASERPEVIAGALRVGAQIQHDLGMTQQAREALTQAQTWAAKIENDLISLAVEAELLLVEASTLRAIQPERARLLVARAIVLFRSTSFPYRLTKAYRIEADILLAMDRPSEAEQSLKAAIVEVERQRRLIVRPADRVMFLDQRRALLDTMVVLQFDHLDQPRRALVYSDRARANVLRDWMSERKAGPEGEPSKRYEDVSARLAGPNGQQVVVTYAVLDLRTIVWVQAPGAPLVTEVIALGREKLEVLTELWVQSLQRGDTTVFRDLGRELHRLLVTPIENALGPRDGTLIVVPDGAIYKLPFSLLRHPVRDRPLFDDHAVVMAPSLADAYQHHQAVVPSTSWRESNILMVVAPTRDSDWNAEALEVHVSDRDIATEFSASLLLEAKDATKSRFLSQAPNFDIVYFGGHSIVDREAPMRSHMLFAHSADNSDPGLLTASEILDLNLSRARLVVLASCATGDGRLSRTEGVESLARPFLAAGTPNVIASLWRVDDAATATFFAQFFRTLLDTPDLAHALRSTQRELARTAPEEAETWGAFVLISGQELGQPSDHGRIEPPTP